MRRVATRIIQAQTTRRLKMNRAFISQHVIHALGDYKRSRRVSSSPFRVPPPLPPFPPSRPTRRPSHSSHLTLDMAHVYKRGEQPFPEEQLPCRADSIGPFLQTGKSRLDASLRVLYPIVALLLTSVTFEDGRNAFSSTRFVFNYTSCHAHHSWPSQITARIVKLCYGLDKDHVDPVR